MGDQQSTNTDLFLSDRARILVPFIATGNKFCIDEAKRLSDGGDLRAVFFDDDSRYSPAYVCALLNSKLLEFYHLRHTKLKRGGYYEYFENQLVQLPIRRIEFEAHPGGAERQAVRSQQIYGDFLRTRDPGAALSHVASLITLNQTEPIHNLLARLAEQMIAMHKEKQAHHRAFRLDLTGYLDEKQMAKLNRLYTPKKPPKEGIRNYEKRLAAYANAAQLARAQLGSLSERILNLDDFWKLNEAQWCWVLRQRLGGKVGGMSELVDVYEKHRAELRPLMRSIQRTDWLIDQVVYQLYGLTEEEIAIVEGKVG